MKMRVTHGTHPFIASSGRRGKIQAPFEANFTNYISLDTDAAEAGPLQAKHAIIPKHFEAWWLRWLGEKLAFHITRILGKAA